MGLEGLGFRGLARGYKVFGSGRGWKLGPLVWAPNLEFRRTYSPHCTMQTLKPKPLEAYLSRGLGIQEVIQAAQGFAFRAF